MSSDEVLRTIWYTVTIPGAAYIGVRVWNAMMMPASLRRPVAIFFWLQASIYVLFMVGLLLLRLWQPVPLLLWLNTGLIGAQALTVVYVILRMRKGRAGLAAVVLTMALLAVWLA